MSGFLRILLAGWALIPFGCGQGSTLSRPDRTASPSVRIEIHRPQSAPSISEAEDREQILAETRRLRKENEALREQLRESQSELERQIAHRRQLAAEVRELGGQRRTQLVDFETRHSELRRSHQNLEVAREQNQREITRLGEELAAAREEARALRTRAERTETENQTLAAELEERIATARRKDKSFESDLTAEREAKQAALARTHSIEREKERLERRVAELARTLEELRRAAKADPKP